MDIQNLKNSENLTNSELREILHSLCVPVPENMARCNILEMFNRVAVPLPKRENRNSLHNRFQRSCTFNNYHKREQKMHSMNSIASKKMKINDSDSKCVSKMTTGEAVSTNYLNNRYLNTCAARCIKDNLTLRKRPASIELPYETYKQAKLSGISPCFKNLNSIFWS